jgi:XisI protein
METMKVRSHIGSDGILLLQMPAEFKDTSVEVVVIESGVPKSDIVLGYRSPYIRKFTELAVG